MRFTKLDLPLKQRSQIYRAELLIEQPQLEFFRKSDAANETPQMLPLGIAELRRDISRH